MTDNETTENTDAVTEIETTETPAASTEGTDAAEGEKPFVFVEDPAFEIEYKGECAYEVKVTIPTANESKKADELYEELKHDVEVPGFRKGRAPRRLIERKFSKHVKNEVQEKLITAAFEKLVKDNKLRPLSGLEIDGLEEAKERAEGEPLAFTLKFEVAPRCELGQYRGVEAERPVLEVSEADIAEAIDQVRGRYSVYEPIEEGAAENGDQVLISFVGTIDGEEFAGGKADNYPYILGSQRFFKEFEEVLTGSSIGQELSTEVTFPDTYSNADLRGKAAQFKIAVKEIKRRQSPELDDKFAEQAGYKNVEDLREKVTAQLREGAAAQSDRVAQSRVLDAVIQGSTFEFPKSLLKKLSDEVYEEELERLRRLHVPESEVRERDEEIRRDAEERSISNIKYYVTLGEVGEAEGVEVTDEDFEREAESIGSRLGMASETVASFINAEEDRRSETERRIFHQKVMDCLMSHAAIKNVEVSREKLDEEAVEADKELA